jgi:hypothetical protein
MDSFVFGFLGDVILAPKNLEGRHFLSFFRCVSILPRIPRIDVFVYWNFEATLLRKMLSFNIISSEFLVYECVELMIGGR